MPCTITPQEEEYYEREHNKKAFGFDGLNIATASACAAFKKLEEQNLIGDLPKFAQLWWKNHKKEDKQREKENAAKGGDQSGGLRDG